MTTPAERTRLRAVRALLIAGAASAIVPGVWAALAPRSFYDSFPGVGHWVRALPAFNEHLTVDAGAFYLAFALLFVWAAVTLRRSLVIPLCAAWALFSVIHLGFHLAHLDGLGTADAAAESLSLAFVLLLPGVIVWLMRRA